MKVIQDWAKADRGIRKVKKMFVDEVSDHLNDKILPFWRNLKDEEHGGYYGLVDFDLKVHREAEKGTILHSRILWFFSNSFLVQKNSRDLECAQHAYHFLMEHCMDQENGGMYWSVTHTGEPMDTTKHSYCQAFAVYALSSYYEASGDKEALAAANAIYELIETKYSDEYGYQEAFDKDFSPVSNDKLSENGVLAEKTMNTLLHVFEAYTELYRVSGQKHVAERMKWILHVFADTIYDEKEKRLNVFFDRKMTNLIDLQSYGHDIEASWLIDRGLEVLGDEALTKQLHALTNQIADTIYARAYKDGALMNECENGVQDNHRIWWVQAEAVVGFLNAYEKNPSSDQFLKAAVSVWEYIKHYVVDRRSGGEWFYMLDESEEPNAIKEMAGLWKCPYHNGRMCLEVIRRKRNAL